MKKKLKVKKRTLVVLKPEETETPAGAGDDCPTDPPTCPQTCGSTCTCSCVPTCGPEETCNYTLCDGPP